ncbi:hypothetical protein CDAR_394921 [Caerostris darwini]|uniref:Uncharacterized protein n=1 Tax=Caerostris darwini TaxID=1538125 RepID=A0AAV4RP59_9ARAC|nr:hypothetical protein CDAR_394921 [Caerostris darwini]
MHNPRQIQIRDLSTAAICKVHTHIPLPGVAPDSIRISTRTNSLFDCQTPIGFIVAASTCRCSKSAQVLLEEMDPFVRRRLRSVSVVGKSFGSW